MLRACFYFSFYMYQFLYVSMRLRGIFGTFLLSAPPARGFSVTFSLSIPQNCLFGGIVDWFPSSAPPVGGFFAAFSFPLSWNISENAFSHNHRLLPTWLIKKDYVNDHSIDLSIYARNSIPRNDKSPLLNPLPHNHNCNNMCHCRQYPADGINNIYCFNGMKSINLKYSCQPQQTCCAGAKQRYHHGNERISHSAKGSYHGIHNTAKCIEASNNLHSHHTCLHNSCTCSIQRQQ